MRSLSSSLMSSVAFAKSNDDGAAETKAEKVIDKAVYIKPEKSLEAIVLNVENAANATLRMVGAMVVHMIVRTYSPIIADRRSFDDTREEVLSALKQYAETKRGQPFKQAWVYRWLNLAKTSARSMVSDYDKKGVQDGSPLQVILRSKTVDKAIDTWHDLTMQKHKAVNSFAALEGALYKKPAKAKAQAGKAKGGNNVTASTDNPKRIARALIEEKGVEILNAMPGKPEAKAVRLADKIGTSNIDHKAFVMRSLTFLDAEALIEVQQMCLDLIKSKNEEPAETPARTRRAATPAA